MFVDVLHAAPNLLLASAAAPALHLLPAALGCTRFNA
jgi:hypothetical protein